MATVGKRCPFALLLAFLLACALFPVHALAEDYTEGCGVNSFRFQDGVLKSPEDIESVEELDEDELLAQAGFVMWKKNSSGKYVSSNGKVIPGALRRGVDVSEWNGTIDWAKAKKDDISFAIIRCGGTYMESRAQYWDDEFERNVSECERLGIPYGVYFFSTATSVADAKKEATFTLNALKGHNPTMPIYYDLEWDELASTSNRKMFAQISTVFCNAIADAGYEPGVYASLSWWENYLTDSCFNRWTKWVAQYYSSCEYTGSYDIWQCTSVASVNGFSGYVDLNFDFRGDWGQSGAWKKSGSSWKYRYDDGTYASGSFVGIGGAIYTFDSNNCALTGWQKLDGEWYYFSPSTCAMQFGWLKDGGKWYFLDATSGTMTYGWADIDGTWYYFDPDAGVMKSGEVFTAGSKKYVADANGACPANSWVKVGSDWYLTDSSCALRTGWVTLSGKKYYLDPKTGIMKCSETFTVSGKTYTANASGYVSDGTSSSSSSSTSSSAGWVSSGSRWWYRNSDGSYPKSEFKNISRTWYYFDGSGWMVTGWRQIGGKWYYFDSSGAMAASRWVGNYYLGSDGAMLVSTKTPDGYYVGADGAWISGGWKSSGSWWWYQNADGSYPASEWKKIGGTWYYFDNGGWMVTGWRQIDGAWYYFESSGAMAASKWVGNYYLGSNGAMLVSTTTPDGYKVGADGAWIR